MTERSPALLPAGLGCISFYDPMQLKSTRADFEESGEDLSFEDWFFPRLKESRLAEALFLFGDLARQVRSRRGEPSFLGHAGEPLEGFFKLPAEALEDRRVEKSLQWSGQIGYLWVWYQVSLLRPELPALLNRWIPEPELPEDLLASRPGLEPLALPEGSWRQTGSLAARLERGQGLLSTANEGAMIVIVGRGEDLQSLRAPRE